MFMRRFSTLFFVAAITYFPGISSAQVNEEKNEIKSYILEEIVVTATRTETPYREIASSVTIITAEELENKQHTLLFDFLRTVPALDVARTGGPGNTSTVFLRGAKPGHTLVLIDGVEANDPISPSRAFDFGTITTDNVEQIEILRGPQSTLYGSDAIAGVINIITKKGVGKPRISFSTEAGFLNTFTNSIGVNGGHERINYTLALSRQVTDGISAAKASDGNSEKDAFSSTSLSARMGLAASEYSGVDVILRFQDTRTDIDNFGGAGGDDPNNVQKLEQLFLRTQGHVFFLEHLWEQKFGFSLTDLHRVNNNDFDTDHPNDMFRGTFDGSILKFDWQNNMYINENNTLTFGVETEEEKASSEYFSESAFGPYTDIFTEKSARTTGYYLQDQIEIGNRFFTAAGIRIDDHSKFGSQTTYRIAPAYLIDQPGMKVKATFGTGFKSPSLFQLYSQYGDHNLKPEKSKGWDIGLEHYLWEEKLILGVTYFQNDFENLIDFDSGTFTYKNLGKAESSGIELSATVAAPDRFTARAHYTFTETEDKSTGEKLLRRAKHKFGLDMNYSFSERAHATLGIVGVGKRDDKDFSTIPAARVTLDSYIVVNLAAAYNLTNKIRIFGRVDNLFDEKYEEVLGYGTYGVSAYGGLKFHL